MTLADDLDVAEALDEVEAVQLVRSAPEAELQAIVELTAKVCGAPLATINVLTETHQMQVATYGFEGAVCRREDSMCAQVIDEDTPLVVPDAREDPRFADNPFVTGEIADVRFYASHRLETAEGVLIGTLCVFDEKPASLRPDQIAALSTLAQRIVDVLELSLRSRQLVDSNRRLASFAGRVSHDLKSPLATLTLSLGMLRDEIAGGAEPEHIEWLIQRALSGSARMSAMVDSVLTYATVGGDLQESPVDLNVVLADVCADLGSALADAVVDVEPMPVVIGDAVQLATVLQNLMDNAAKYRREDRQLHVSVTSRREGDNWRFCVVDNGRGIPEADRARVLMPMVRLDDDDRGSGIGLDTCRHVIEAHGGQIAIEETPGGGTTVCFELPAHD